MSLSKPKPSLSPDDFQAFTLQSKTEVSPNTALYQFALPSEEHVLGLPIGQHISVRAKISGQTVQRNYTPVSSDDDFGHFDLLIKVYIMFNFFDFDVDGSQNVCVSTYFNGERVEPLWRRRTSKEDFRDISLTSKSATQSKSKVQKDV